jgi:hypothetical protein
MPRADRLAGADNVGTYDNIRWEPTVTPCPHQPPRMAAKNFVMAMRVRFPLPDPSPSKSSTSVRITSVKVGRVITEVITSGTSAFLLTSYLLLVALKLVALSFVL